LLAVNPAGQTVEVDIPGELLASSLEKPVMLWGVEDGLRRTGQGWMLSLPAVQTGVYQI
jgi:hypothetical protein